MISPPETVFLSFSVQHAIKIMLPVSALHILFWNVNALLFFHFRYEFF